MIFMKAFAHSIHCKLHEPRKILIYCLIFFIMYCLLNGSWIRLYKLHRDSNLIATQITDIESQIANLNSQLKKAKDPSFIERQALELYDMANEEDLVFVFSD